MKYGFLFGTGAEYAYKLPSGGRFALDIFRQDTTESKNEFKKMRMNVDPTTPYAADWLPENYLNKNISVFGKSVFTNIIKSTVEHRRSQIVHKVNGFDDDAKGAVKKLKADEKLDVDEAFKELLGKEVTRVKLSQVIAYNDVFKDGNKLFKSNYFSALLSVYKDKKDESDRKLLGRMILSIMQLQIGALSEGLVRNINDNLFVKKDDDIDLFEDFGELIKLNYNAAGVSGLEFLLEYPKFEAKTPYGVVLRFAQYLLEEIYSSVLDYKAVIDAYWHYIYSPSSDWAKFCKMSIFLLTVRRYIAKSGAKADKSDPNGYYNMLQKSLRDGRFELSAIATTNYNKIIQDILGDCDQVTFLNGSVDSWYDPYLNKIGSKEELDNGEHHIIVPLIFTQSGTKPMTSISMSEKYVDLYRKWKTSDAIVAAGFGFGTDDEHINGILRTLVNDDGKKLIVVTVPSSDNSDREVVARKLKISDLNKIEIKMVDGNGRINDTPWTDCLGS